MTINEIQDEIIDEFSEVEDWMDRYSMISIWEMLFPIYQLNTRLRST